MHSEPYIEQVAERTLDHLQRTGGEHEAIRELRKIIAIEEKDKKLVRGSIFLIKEILHVVDKDLHYLETDRGYELQIMRMLKHRYSMLKVLRRTLKEMHKHMYEILRLEYIHDDPKHITKMFIHHINEVLKEANQSLAMVYKELKSHEGDIADFKRMKEKLKLLHDKLAQLSADERFLYKLENTIKEF